MQNLWLRNICKSFGTTRALLNIDLQIPGGKRLLLIGGSGAGKTTLLRVLAGLEQPDRGSVVCGENDITRQPPHRRGIALLSQDYAIYPHLTVERNLAAALEPLRLAAGDRRDRIESALRWFELQPIRDRRPAQLSGGQLQRAALAKALVRRPQVLVLDEPLSQLDPALREQSRELILSLAQQFATTLVMVTHDPLDALRMADQVAVLENGVLVQADTPQAVYRSPQTRSVAEILSPFGINDVTLATAPARTSTQRFHFRPEAGEPISTHRQPGTDDAIFLEGVVLQLQFLGFAKLAFIEVTQHGPPQVIKILVHRELPAIGQSVCVRVSKCDLLPLEPQKI